MQGLGDVAARSSCVRLFTLVIRSNPRRSCGRYNPLILVDHTISLTASSKSLAKASANGEAL